MQTVSLCHRTNAAAGPPNDKGQTCTATPGVLGYYEITRMVDKKDVKIDPNGMAAYARYGDSNWVGFDNQESHRQKICYARFRNLAGVFLWDGEVDDNLELAKAAHGNYQTANCGDFKKPSC